MGSPWEKGGMKWEVAEANGLGFEEEMVGGAYIPQPPEISDGVPKISATQTVNFRYPPEISSNLSTEGILTRDFW